MHPRGAMNAVHHMIVNLLKTCVVCFGDSVVQFSGVNSVGHNIVLQCQKSVLYCMWP